MKKFLVIHNTNGEGYSSPTIHQVATKVNATIISDKITLSLKNGGYERDLHSTPVFPINTTFLKETILFADSEDNVGLHIITLLAKKFYLLSIGCNYADDINLSQFDTIDEAREAMKSLIEAFKWYETEEDIEDEFFGEGEDSVFYKIISTN